MSSPEMQLGFMILWSESSVLKGNHPVLVTKNKKAHQSRSHIEVCDCGVVFELDRTVEVKLAPRNTAVSGACYEGYHNV